MGGTSQWVGLLVVWALLGAATSTILTPSARLLRRNSTEQNRSAVFAAQFSLSHACFLITYPLAGILGATIGLPAVALVLGAIGILGAVLAVLTWRGTSDTMLLDLGQRIQAPTDRRSPKSVDEDATGGACLDPI